MPSVRMFLLLCAPAYTYKTTLWVIRSLGVGGVGWSGPAPLNFTTFRRCTIRAHVAGWSGPAPLEFEHFL